MKVWSAMFNMVAVLIILLWVSMYYNISSVIQRDFDQVRLNYAVEYATEAMFEATLESEDLNIDYTDLTRVYIDSSDALDIFCSLMCFSYDMSLSDQNFVDIENSIASVVLAGSDGFYIGQFADYNYIDGNAKPSDGLRLRWSVKRPYLMKFGNYTYAVSYGYEDWERVTKVTTSTNISNSQIYQSNNEGYPMGVTEESVKHAVNTQIRDAMLFEIARKNMSEAFDYKFYLPDETTVNHVNSIEPPAILLIMEDVGFASTEPICALSVSGFKITSRVNVVGFIDRDTNRSYYCYESQLFDDEKDACCGGNGSFHIENYYRDVKDAAEDISSYGDHYSPYFDIMARKITKE